MSRSTVKYPPPNLVLEDIQDFHRASALANRRPEGLKYSETPISIPSPDLFTTLTDPRPDLFPTVGECSVHLELLQVFHTLRYRIVGSKVLDKTFGTEPQKRTVNRKRWRSKERKYVDEPVELREKKWPTRRQKKWDVYLEYAAARFVVWAKETNEFLRVAGDQRKPTLHHTPPLDILMVWHALLLNPETYRTYCSENILESLVKVPFPWARIHKAIIARKWAYEPSTRSEDWIRKQARLEPDLYDYFIELGQPADAKLPSSKQPSSIDNVKKLVTPEVPSVPVQPLEEKENKLIDNVLRQMKFVDKMHAHLWIASPSTKGTMTRAVERYENFLQLFKLCPGKMLVPTLDVDIVWHTHQLSAVEYGQSMQSRCGWFINHNDKIAQDSLDDGTTETSELYRVHFGETYSACLCWDCEALLDMLKESEDIDYLELAKRVKQVVEMHRRAERQRRIWFDNVVMLKYCK